MPTYPEDQKFKFRGGGEGEHALPLYVRAAVHAIAAQRAHTLINARLRPAFTQRQVLENIYEMPDLAAADRIAELSTRTQPSIQFWLHAPNPETPDGTPVPLDYASFQFVWEGRRDGYAMVPDNPTTQLHMLDSVMSREMNDWIGYCYFVDEMAGHVIWLTEALSAYASNVTQIRYVFPDLRKLLSLSDWKDDERMSAFLRKWDSLGAPQRTGGFWEGVYDDIAGANRGVGTLAFGGSKKERAQTGARWATAKGSCRVPKRFAERAGLLADSRCGLPLAMQF